MDVEGITVNISIIGTSRVQWMFLPTGYSLGSGTVCLGSFCQVGLKGMFTYISQNPGDLRANFTDIRVFCPQYWCI